MPVTNPYRLDRSVVPVTYAIELEPDLERFVFRGSEEIVIRALKPFSRITLHALDLKIVKASLDPAGSRDSLPARRIDYDPEMETVTLDFGRVIPRQKAARLRLEFTGELNDQMHGFYRTRYEAGGRERWGAATQFEATDARRAFPCWDEPDFKAQFDITLTVPSGLTALSNMPVRSQRRAGNGKKRISYETTPVMSTYLVAFVVADLVYSEAKDRDGVLIRVYTAPGKKEQGRFGLDVALHTLPFFADWFGIPYALPKLDMVALPDFASGAMENWGLVTYRETALLVDPKQSSASARQRVAEVIDHELAHQWFGNLVTMKWWTDLWLNEGFASFMGPKAVDRQFPEWKVWDQYFANECLGALRADSLRNTHPIEIPVKNPHEIREIFDAITYSRGSVVYRMLEHYLGEAVFRQGLRRYLKRHAFGNAGTGDLWRALEEVSGKPVSSLMAAYTRQPGYPLVSVESRRRGENLTLSLEQSRFLFDGAEDRDNLRWKVPVAMTGAGLGKQHLTLLGGRRTSIRLPVPPGGWVKLNAGQTGFYRVRYPEELLRPLVARLEQRAFSVSECLGILSDVFALTRSGHATTAQALDLIWSARKETDFNVWAAMIGMLRDIENVLTADRALPELQVLGRKLLLPVARRLGWDPRPEDRYSDILLRSMALSNLGHFGELETVQTARRKFLDHTRNGRLNPNLRQAVYAIAAEFGTAAEYEGLLEIYASAGMQEEKVRVLRALTRVRDSKQIPRILKFALSPRVRPQDSYVILGGFGGNPAAREAAWDFVRANWRVLEKRYRGGSVNLFGHIVEGAVTGFSTLEKWRSVRAFLNMHPVQGTERTVRQSLEVIKSNAAWAGRGTRELRAWFSANAPTLRSES
ncbi:MAG: M1 family metallopeptidase [Candidatus Omnitrophica bacterium]|nr:M1 family metallopeptidase [Candidatus Omnitrophota bacterium]